MLVNAPYCTVFAPTRLHLGLIDCSDATQRRFGGVGIALEDPGVRLRVSAYSKPRSAVVGLDSDEGLTQALLAAVRAVSRDGLTVLVEVEQLPPRHIGLGTGTAARLAVAAGAAHIAGLDLAVRDLALLCRRGGTSGIGVNAFELGGVIFDGGRAVERDEPFVPSRYQTPSCVPPVVSRLVMPPQWEVALLCPDGRVVEGNDEREFFERELPVPSTESLQTMGYAYHGVAPALLEEDLYALSYALREIHSTGFKKRELARQSDEVQTLLSRLHEHAVVAAGMSSLGPLIYAITDRHNRVASQIVRTIAASAGIEVRLALPARAGYRIESSSDAEL